MKAIRTRYIGPSNTKPSRIVAETGEHGQRVMISFPSHLDSNKAHALVCRMLCDKYGWKEPMIGGGFPDGSMVWVFANSQDVA